MGQSFFMKTIGGLMRNATGGFGGVVAEPTQSNGSGARFYGLG